MEYVIWNPGGFFFQILKMTFQSHFQHFQKNPAYIKGVMFFVAVVVVEIKQSQKAGKQSKTKLRGR